MLAALLAAMLPAMQRRKKYRISLWSFTFAALLPAMLAALLAAMLAAMLQRIKYRKTVKRFTHAAALLQRIKF
jgi:hypothetical protein